MDLDIEEVRRAFPTDPNGRERFWVRLEERSVDMTGDSPRLSGLATVFEQRAKVRLPDGRIALEQVMPSAFNNTLNRGDIFLLWQHDMATPLARTGAGNLQLRTVAKGLEYEAELPDTQAARDAAELVRRGIVNQMSFGFIAQPGGDKITVEPDGVILRSLYDVRLHEVSLVSMAAYPNTSANVRADAFSMICRSLGVDENEILDLASREDLLDLATLRSAVASQQTAPGAVATSEDAQRAVPTAVVGVHPSDTPALRRLLERAASPGDLPKELIRGISPASEAGRQAGVSLG